MADEDVDGEPGKKTAAEIAAERLRSLGGERANHVQPDAPGSNEADKFINRGLRNVKDTPKRST